MADNKSDQNDDIYYTSQMLEIAHCEMEFWKIFYEESEVCRSQDIICFILQLEYIIFGLFLEVLKMVSLSKEVSEVCG